MPSGTLRAVLRNWATISTKRRNIPGTALFHGKTFEIFPAGALGPYRIEHSGDAIRRIVAVDPNEHDVISDFKELMVDPMSERLALGGERGQRATFPDYCDRARWIVDAKVPGHADSWLSTIEEAAGRRDSEREYLGRGDWKKTEEAHECSAQQGGVCGHARLLEGCVAEENASRVRGRCGTRRISFALRRRSRRRSARDGAHEWSEGGAFRRLRTRRPRPEVARVRCWPTSTPASFVSR